MSRTGDAVRVDVSPALHAVPSLSASGAAAPQAHRARRDSNRKSSSTSSRRSSKQSSDLTSARGPPSAAEVLPTNTRPSSRRTTGPKSRNPSSSAKTHESSESVSSISNDPFFRIYQSPESRRLAGAIAAGVQSSTSAQALRAPQSAPRPDGRLGPSALPSLTILDPDPGQEWPLRDAPDIRLLVIGAANVGKTTFVQRLISPTATSIPTSDTVVRIRINGEVHTIAICERRAAGTDGLANLGPLSVDGALVLYDVLNQQSIAVVPNLLGTLADRGIPAVLVSGKTDVAAQSRQLDPDLIESAGVRLSGVVATLQTAASRAGSQARCVAALLQRILAQRGAADQTRSLAAPSRRRANSDAPTERVPSTSPPPIGRRRRPKHERANSEVSVTRQRSLVDGLANSDWHLEDSAGAAVHDANAFPARSHSRRPGHSQAPSREPSSTVISPAASTADPTSSERSASGVSAATKAKHVVAADDVGDLADAHRASVGHRSVQSSSSGRQSNRTSKSSNLTSTSIGGTTITSTRSNRRQSYNRASTTSIAASSASSRKASATKARRSSSSASTSLQQNASAGSAGGKASSGDADLVTTSNAGAPTGYVPRLSVVDDSPTRTKRRSSAKPAKQKVVQSFLIMDDDVDEGQRVSDDIPILEREDEPKAIVRSRDPGFSLKELVDRLLAQPLSKADANFAAIFLCLYRKFASPAALLDAMLIRFAELDAEEPQQLLRIGIQLRHLAIMTQWVMGYPGDFAHPKIRHRLSRFIAGLSHHRAFAVAAKEMRAQLDVLVEDDDACWARADAEPGKAVLEDRTLSTSTGFSAASASTLPVDGGAAADAIVGSPSDRDEDEDDGDGDADGDADGDGEDAAADDGGRSARTSGAASSTSSGGASANWSGASFQTLLNAAENADREAQRLVPNPRTPLTKLHWHAFMDMLEEDIAEEMTRIDWIMFSSIRPRDLVRHVSLKASQKEQCKSLENVNRMITHFNHVAYWVSNMILLREKPKHRALALEKFITIAWKLRQANNYNSLGAVIAGINANAVHRLAQTRELVPQAVQKDFMRLEILMGTQKSHFAYRLAWENTSSSRIPFIPLHRRDLVSAEEGNRTFLDPAETRINWKKFEIMGEVIVSIQKSQGSPYLDLPRSNEAQRLLLDCVLVKDDDDLYERSTRLEGPGGVQVDGSKKVFAWFR